MQEKKTNSVAQSFSFKKSSSAILAEKKRLGSYMDQGEYSKATEYFGNQVTKLKSKYQFELKFELELFYLKKRIAATKKTRDLFSESLTFFCTAVAEKMREESYTKNFFDYLLEELLTLEDVARDYTQLVDTYDIAIDFFIFNRCNYANLLLIKLGDRCNYQHQHDIAVNFYKRVLINFSRLLQKKRYQPSIVDITQLKSALDRLVIIYDNIDSGTADVFRLIMKIYDNPEVLSTLMELNKTTIDYNLRVDIYHICLFLKFVCNRAEENLFSEELNKAINGTPFEDFIINLAMDLSYFIAIDMETTDKLKILLEAQMPLKVKNKEGFTPLQYATKQGKHEAIKLLVTRVELEETSANSRILPPLYLAIEQDDIKTIKIFLKRGVKLYAHTSSLGSPLYFAIVKNRKDIAIVLNKKKARLREQEFNELSNPAHGGHILFSDLRNLGRSLTEMRENPFSKLLFLLAGETQSYLTPLFCPYGLAGNFDLRKFAAMISLIDGRPVYGIASPGIIGKDRKDPLATMEEKADLCIKVMKSKQEEGPYLIIGASFSGWLALEIARQLRSRKEKVFLTAMFDTIAPLKLKEMTKEEHSVYLGKIITTLYPLFKFPADHKLLSPTEFQHLSKEEQIHLVIPENLPSGAIDTVKTVKSNLLASGRYTPEDEDSPHLLCFSVEETRKIFGDDLGWGKQVSSDFLSHHFVKDANHFSLAENTEVIFSVAKTICELDLVKNADRKLKERQDNRVLLYVEQSRRSNSKVFGEEICRSSFFNIRKLPKPDQIRYSTQDHPTKITPPGNP